jgi:hypothetical protein
MNPLATVPLSSKQQKITAKVQAVMGPESQVLYATLARANFAMTPGSWVLGALFVAMVAQGAAPGLILLLIFRELVTVPRFVAVTPSGVSVLDRAPIGGAPRKVTESCSPGNVSFDESKRKLLCATKTYRANKRDFIAFKATVDELQAGRVDINPVRTLVGAY